MNEWQWKVYTNYITTYKKNNYAGSDDVKKLILRDLKYRNLHLINPELMLNLDCYYDDPDEEKENEVWVFYGFMRPGRQCFAVVYPDIDEEKEVEEEL